MRNALPIGISPRSSVVYSHDHILIPCRDDAAAEEIAYSGRLSGDLVSGTMAIEGTTGSLFDGLAWVTPSGDNRAVLTTAAAGAFANFANLSGVFLALGMYKYATALATNDENIFQFGTMAANPGGWYLEFETSLKLRTMASDTGNTLSQLAAGDAVIDHTVACIVDAVGLKQYVVVDGDWANRDEDAISINLPGSQAGNGSVFNFLAGAFPIGTIDSPLNSAGGDVSLSEWQFHRLANRTLTAAQIQRIVVEHAAMPRERLLSLVNFA